jgi:hypothetical protein
VVGEAPIFHVTVLASADDTERVPATTNTIAAAIFFKFI